MKKHLIAASLVAAFAAPAMAQVTVNGLLDFAYGSVKRDGQGAEATISTRDITSATSVIRVIAVEDLGGGMKVTAHYGLDPRVLSNDAGALGRDELFLGIEGGFGNLRLGSPNSIGLTTFLTGSPLGTGVGSGYGPLAADYSAIRYSRSARYDSPNFGGFRFAVLHAPGADAAVAATTNAATATTNNMTPTTSNYINAGTTVNEFGLSYSAGPLAFAFANINLPAFGTSGKASNNSASVSYALGNTTLFGGWNNGDTTARLAEPTRTKGSRVALRHNFGTWDLILSHARQEAGDVKESVSAGRVDYKLSKTAVAYGAYEVYDNGADTNPDRTTVSVGLRKSF